jgi:hypothetical protein
LQNANHQDNDEALAALQYRRDFCFASGHNVAARTSGIEASRPDRAYKLTTTWLPTAEVMRVLPDPPADAANVPMGMEALAPADLAQSEQVIARLQPMVKAYRHWIARQPAHPIEDPVLNETAKNLCSQALDCADRIEAGIQLLADPLVRESFRTMNLVMAQAQRQRSAFIAHGPPDQIGRARGTRTPGWRLFQLGFVLMNLPGLAQPESDRGRADRETVELLFFPTGGGKTEACLDWRPSPWCTDASPIPASSRPESRC